ncbi:hypothetical protein FB451DRAFT_1560291 [Mycena latifolia]|nr:hypothetical protein FB451DRAFT_1560291 [Mycena latifolia]
MLQANGIAPLARNKRKAPAAHTPPAERKPPTDRRPPAERARRPTIFELAAAQAAKMARKLCIPTSSFAITLTFSQDEELKTLADAAEKVRPEKLQAAEDRLAEMEKKYGQMQRIFGLDVEGAEASPEYGVKIGRERYTATCWIPSTAGKKFAVHWTNRSYRHPTMGSVKIDGVNYGGIVMHADPGTLPETTCHDGVILEDAKLRPFMFTSLEVIDDSDEEDELESIEELGVIELTIQRVNIKERLGQPSQSNALFRYEEPEGDMMVHERVKEAVGAERITLGESEELAEEEEILSFERVGPPLAQFTFKYRPLSMLQANGIAPLPRNKRKTPAPHTPPAECKPPAERRPARPSAKGARRPTIFELAAAQAYKKAKLLADAEEEVRVLRDEEIKILADAAEKVRPVREKLQAAEEKLAEMEEDYGYSRKRVKLEEGSG